MDDVLKEFNDFMTLGDYSDLNKLGMTVAVENGAVTTISFGEDD